MRENEAVLIVSTAAASGDMGSAAVLAVDYEDCEDDTPAAVVKPETTEEWVLLAITSRVILIQVNRDCEDEAPAPVALPVAAANPGDTECVALYP